MFLLQSMYHAQPGKKKSSSPSGPRSYPILIMIDKLFILSDCKDKKSSKRAEMQVLKGYNISHRIDKIRTSDAWGESISVRLQADAMPQES